MILNRPHCPTKLYIEYQTGISDSKHAGILDPTYGHAHCQFYY